MYTSFFRTLEGRLPGWNAVSQQALIEIYGAGELRRRWVIVRFLIEYLAIDWDVTCTAGFKEARRTDALLDAARGESRGHVLQGYAESLVAARPRSGLV